MTPLEHKIRAGIKRDGPMSVGDYMTAVLGDAEHGYYRRRDRFGADGDFITAPGISQVFGELTGLWCAVTWRQMGAPSPSLLVELGPGQGTMMADALRAARVVPGLTDALVPHLVETSAVLRDKQRAALAGTSATWHDRLEDVPAGPTLLLANEFFDALPIEQYVRTETDWRRLAIGLDGATGRLGFVPHGRPVDPDAVLRPAMRGAPPGTVCEVSPAREKLARRLGRRLNRYGGAALIVDYGPARSCAGDSLQAVRRHSYCDVLSDPGEADVTAHVDFEALAEAASDAGACAYGPISQGDFLERLGIETRARRLARGNPGRADDIRAACRRLTDRNGMGGLFKVMALTHPDLAAPAGFEEDGDGGKEAGTC